jgi:hypothetical protein
MLWLLGYRIGQRYYQMQMFRALALYLLFIPLAVFAQDNLSARVHVIPEQSFPLSIIHASLSNFQYISQLDMLLSWPEHATPSAVQYQLLITKGNQIIAGEGWTTKNPAGDQHTQTLMHLSYGDVPYLGIGSVISSGRRYSVPMLSVVNAVNRELDGQQVAPLTPEVALFHLPNSLTTVNAQLESSPQPNFVGFCSAALGQAQNACQNGVHSFSCNATQQSYSFTCN